MAHDRYHDTRHGQPQETHHLLAVFYILIIPTCNIHQYNVY
jgi:hypothetical protein